MLRIVADRIRLITDLSDLHHSLYIELYPGPNRDRCWCSDSVFMTEDAFAFVEPIFRYHIPEYDHYTFMELPRLAGIRVVGALTALARAIDGEPLIAPLTECAATAFALIGQGSSEEHKLVARLAMKLATWLEWQFADESMVSVIGI